MQTLHRQQELAEVLLSKALLRVAVQHVADLVADDGSDLVVACHVEQATRDVHEAAKRARRDGARRRELVPPRDLGRAPNRLLAAAERVCVAADLDAQARALQALGGVACNDGRRAASLVGAP